MNAGQINRLGLDAQTMFGMPPIDHIMLASELGCGHISTGLSPVLWKLQRFPQWSLRESIALRREMIAVMRDRGVIFAQGDGCIVRAGLDVRGYASDLDLFAELGALQISTVAMDPDAIRAQAQLALLAEMADQRGMGLTLEFAPPHTINTFEKALSAIRAIDKPNVRLTIDAMHFFRSGGTLDQLASASGSCVVGHVQLCDVPLLSAIYDYYQEACFERLLPGEGDLPLLGLLAVVPKNVRIGLEIPMRTRIGVEGELEALAARAVELARDLLATDAQSLSGYYTAKGDKIATQRSTSIRYRADMAREMNSLTATEDPPWTDEELAELEDKKFDWIKMLHDLGHNKRYSNEVQIGDALPTRIFGPHNIVTFTTEWRAYLFTLWCGVHRRTDLDIAALGFTGPMAGKEQDPVLEKENPELTDGAYIGPSRGHLFPRWARYIGMPRAYGYGASMGSWILDYLAGWAGEWGMVVHSNCAYRSPALSGDITVCNASVLDKSVDKEGRSIVHVDFKMTNQSGITLSTAKAEIELPTR